MALIVDPDDLNQGFEVNIDTSLRTIELSTTGSPTNLSNDGVTLQALYSFLKEEWKTDPLLIPFPFPLIAITPEQFEWIEDWKPLNNTTRKLIRTGGWRELDENSVLNSEYFGVITLGNIDSTSKDVGDKAYYFFDSDTVSTEFDFAGPVNEAVQTFGDINNGNFDKRAEVFTVRIRIFGNTYDESTTTTIGVTTITNKVERFPLSETTDAVISDLGVTTNDIDTTAPYTDMCITYYDTPQTRTGFTTGSDTFDVIIDGDLSEPTQDGSGAATAEQIYAFVQRQLVLDDNINCGVGSPAGSPAIGDFVNVNGLLANPLVTLASTGNTMSTLEQASNPADTGSPSGTFIGVYIDSFSSNDKNRLEFFANSGLTVVFPFVAAGTINFNNNLVTDSAGEYWMFYQYTTRTSVSDLQITGASSNTGTVESAGGNLPTVAQNEYVALSGFANPENNGVWLVTDASPTVSAFTATKIDGDQVVNEGGIAGFVDENPINSPDAIIVDNNSGVDIVGDINSSSVSFDYDYDGNTQGGRTPATDAAVIIRGIGLETAQFIETTGTITRNVGLSFTLVSALERNYDNA